jgi:hypothetical protein
VQQCRAPVLGIGLAAQQTGRDQLVDECGHRVAREEKLLGGLAHPQAGAGDDQAQQLDLRPAQPGVRRFGLEPAPDLALDRGQKFGQLGDGIFGGHPSITSQ